MNGNSIFYHGSSIGGIQIFKPTHHIVGGGREIVFATNDRAYALAMIHSSGDNIAVSYSPNTITRARELYCDELKEGAFEVFNQEGYLYEVSSEFFFPSPEGLEGEYVSYDEVPVLKEIKIINIKDELIELVAHLVEYKDVPESMEMRGKFVGKPAHEHSPGRFK